MNAQLEKARILYNQGRHKLAAEELTQALGQNPENAEAISLYAVTLAQLGDIKQALERNALALGKIPDNPQFHYRSAVIWRRAGHLTNSINALLEAIRLNPRNPDYYSYLANVRCSSQSLYHAALALADKGLACDPEHIGSLNERARALVCLGRNTEAAATIDHSLKLSPNEPDTHALRGWLEINHNNPKRAEANFLEALRNDPEYTNAQKGLARARNDKNPLKRLLKTAASIGTTLVVIIVVATIVLMGAAAFISSGANKAPSTGTPGIPIGSIVVIAVFVLTRLLRKNN